ncbi:MAG: hypothetical protein RHS_3710 [Robinsoniella sp. RHS]|nr:MAG: hypothetical protein RHS_3710 [Robinsoniella sp. RHS]
MNFCVLQIIPDTINTNNQMQSYGALYELKNNYGISRFQKYGLV